MSTLLASLIILILALSSSTQDKFPDLTRKEDLKALGVGRIVEADKSIIRHIVLHEIRDYWIVYEKSGSLHNLMMDKIDRIEFPDGKFPALKIRFPDNRPVISRIFLEEKRKAGS